MGIEPTSSAWKAEVLAVELHPLLMTKLLTIQAWWRGEDSNLRRLSQQIYSLPPLTAREPLPENSSKRMIIRLIHRLLSTKQGLLLS